MTSFSFLIRYSWELPCMDMLYIYLCQWTFISWEKKHMKKEDGKEYKKKYERESRQALKTSEKTNRLSLNIKKKDQSMPIDFRELIFNTQF